MNAKTKTKVHVPGENDDDGAPRQPQLRPPVEVPADATHEQLVAGYQVMQQQMAAMLAKMAELQAQGSVSTADGSPKAVSHAKAKEIIADALANDEPPPPVLTVDGWLVHPLAHATAEKVEESNDKAAKRASTKKG